MPKDVTLEAHATAPRSVRDLQKYYQKLPVAFIPDTTPHILDFRNLDSAAIDANSSLKIIETISPEKLAEVYQQFLEGQVDPTTLDPVNVYEHTSLPGLRILPSLLPIQVQETLLSKLLLRDLSNQEHLTNVHLHYNVPYPDTGKSFFDLPESTIFSPKDPDLHKPLGVVEILEKKLRWMTLGGQYNWTTKEYPDGPPVRFPQDVRNLVHGIFPSVEPEAAICNTYSPGDTLSTHRDVSEEADKDLVSISVGCEALFLISLSPESQEENAVSPTIVTPPKPQSHKHKKKNKGKEPPPPPPPLDDHTLIIRIRSGDAVVMGGQSRWAWHGVPKVIGDTCPEELTQWPNLYDRQSSDNADTIDWAGWMKRKRVNLNIRQMYDSSNPN
ncbi:hypothetical protein TWF481_006433 [Arthrobotrys musiformis]|uniref:Fe2OG dioxygenase domain-containing protein n=1 Tax=Arthrobotrys musiformis TaxID=47236 RepID=A0AAV9WGV2_9PEZI